MSDNLNQAISNLQAISNMSDDEHVQEIAHATADLIGDELALGVRLREAHDRLVEAVRPFAALAATVSTTAHQDDDVIIHRVVRPLADDDFIWYVNVTVRDIRRAAQVLEESNG